MLLKTLTERTLIFLIKSAKWAVYPPLCSDVTGRQYQTGWLKSYCVESTSLNRGKPSLLWVNQVCRGSGGITHRSRAVHQNGVIWYLAGTVTHFGISSSYA